MAKLPEKDVAVALELAGLGTMSQAPGPQTIAWGPPLSPELPGVQGIKLWVFSTGGAPPVPYMGGGVVNEYIVGLQVRVRSTGEDFVGGQALARAVRDALHCKPPATYFDLRADTSDPLYLGVLDPNLHEWSVPLTIHWTG